MRRRSRRETLTRRKALIAAGGVAAGLAGCAEASTNDEEDDGPTVVASFFTFYDFARKIAEGTPVSVQNLVPTGLHGHGWEPDPSITRDIVDADGLIHVGVDFQPWVDRAIETLHSDDVDTQLINVRDGIDLIDLADTLEDEEEVGDGKDPHFWLDPHLAKISVENIATGLAEIAPAHETTFEENAADVKADLDDIDATWESIFGQAERDVVFLAAHNAFEYIARQYGATIQPLVVNLAANDDVRPADMRRAEDTIAENDIRYIGAAVFEPRRPARQLLDETAVEAYFPVTPYAGITETWEDAGWGYFEIARNINMETFRIVLDTAAPEPDFDEAWRNFE